MAVNPRMSNKYPETSEGEPSREPGRGDATPSHEVGAAPTRRRLSVVEIRQASDEISKLLGYSDGIKRAKREMFAKYGLSPKRTTRLIKAILASWHAEAEASRKDQKIKQTRRIEGHIRDAGAAGNWREVAGLETQLAKILGTEAPLAFKMEATMLGVVGPVLAVMTPEAMAALAAQYDEMQRRALQASAIDVVPILPAVTETADEPKKQGTPD